MIAYVIGRLEWGRKMWARDPDGLRLAPGGVHKGGIFAKSVAWQDVAGTEVKSPYLRVLARRGDKTRKAVEIQHNTWNAVLLPRVLDTLAASAS
jgi:hypothetical protein